MIEIYCRCLLAAGYSVLYVRREGSARPFVSRVVRAVADAGSRLSVLPDGRVAVGPVPPETAAAVAAGAAVAAEGRLLEVPFTSVGDYLHVLREAASACAPAEERAMFVLAAAVSDFYVPERELVCVRGAPVAVWRAPRWSS